MERCGLINPRCLTDDNARAWATPAGLGIRTGVANCSVVKLTELDSRDRGFKVIMTAPYRGQSHF